MVCMAFAAPPFVRTDMSTTINEAAQLQILDGSNNSISLPSAIISGHLGASLNPLHFQLQTYRLVRSYALETLIHHQQRSGSISFWSTATSACSEIRPDTVRTQRFGPWPMKAAGWDYNEARNGVGAQPHSIRQCFKSSSSFTLWTWLRRNAWLNRRDFWKDWSDLVLMVNLLLFYVQRNMGRETLHCHDGIIRWIRRYRLIIQHVYIWP